MPLSAGTRLGAYEILSPLGTGGMGEVYRATDSNLKRSVAIKVLPASVASDGDRLARFQREAEVLAALNHPNIGSIYGLEKTPDFTALVMELVEGPTLADRIARGPIPIDEALRIAKQIARREPLFRQIEHRRVPCAAGSTRSITAPRTRGLPLGLALTSSARPPPT